MASMCRVCRRWLARQLMEWVDLGLKRSDEYRKSQATFAVDRFSRSLFGFGIESRWHVHCGWLPLFVMHYSRVLLPINYPHTFLKVSLNCLKVLYPIITSLDKGWSLTLMNEVSSCVLQVILNFDPTARIITTNDFPGDPDFNFLKHHSVKGIWLFTVGFRAPGA